MSSASFITFNPSALSVAASATHRNRNKQQPNTNWFTPLFGWSNSPDYLETRPDPEAEPKPVARPRGRGFTDEKAKQLRMTTTGKEAFHDAMYHSAIASRLASDFSSVNPAATAADL